MPSFLSQALPVSEKLRSLMSASSVTDEAAIGPPSEGPQRHEWSDYQE